MSNLERARQRLDWVRSRMALLAGLRLRFAAERPFAGLSIGVSLHLEPKTAILIETLAAGGARIVGTGNFGSTQDDIVAALRAQGMDIVGRRDVTLDEHLADVRYVVDSRPDIFLDNGADLCAIAIDHGFAGQLRGATEETTSGGDRLREDYAGRVPFPVIVINDSPLKAIVENKHAVGQSAVESLMRIGNLMVNARRCVVVGYGWCGRGVAHYLKAMGARVAVAEVDPVKALEAAMDGCKVGPLRELAAWGQIFITVTARENVLGREHFAAMPDGAVLGNCGHFPTEIDVAALKRMAREATAMGPGLDQYTMPDGRRLTLLADGRMFNLAGLEPKGNSIESMDLGFTLQALSLERIARDGANLAPGAQPVPKDINDALARAMVAALGGSV